MCYICGAIALVADIIDESVFAFILEWKSGKFSNDQGEQHTRHRVLVLWHFRCPIPANTGVGYCLFGHRYSRTSIQIDKNQPHTFFILYNCLIRGWWANKKLIYYEEISSTTCGRSNLVGELYRLHR